MLKTLLTSLVMAAVTVNTIVAQPSSIPYFARPSYSAISTGGGISSVTNLFPNLVPVGAQFTDKGGYGGYNLTVTPNQLYYATATTNTAAYGLFVVDGVNAGVDPQYGPVNGVSAPTPVLFVPTSSTIQLVNDSVTSGSANQIAVYSVNNNLYGNFNGTMIGTNYGDGSGISNLTHVVISDDSSSTLNLKDSVLTLGYGNGLTSGSSDSLFHIRSLATSPYNSGSGINFDIMGINPSGKSVLITDISATLIYVGSNKFGGILPGNLEIVCNHDTGYMRGFSICAPGISQLDDGNSSLYYGNFVTGESGVPIWVKGVWQPTDVAYSFTVSGVATPPNVNDIYTNNNQRFTIVRGTSIVAGSGTIFGTVTGGGAPTASGTLKRMTGNGSPGDATISFSASTITGKWIYATYVNPINGNFQVASNSFFTNMITVYNGVASKANNLAAPTSITFPNTTVNWTNTQLYNIQMYIDNGAVTGTAIKKNGTTIFSSVTGDATFLLQPGEYFSETYTVGTPVGKWSAF